MLPRQRYYCNNIAMLGTTRDHRRFSFLVSNLCEWRTENGYIRRPFPIPISAAEVVKRCRGPFTRFVLPETPSTRPRLTWHRLLNSVTKSFYHVQSICHFTVLACASRLVELEQGTCHCSVLACANRLVELGVQGRSMMEYIALVYLLHVQNCLARQDL